MAIKIEGPSETLPDNGRIGPPCFPVFDWIRLQIPIFAYQYSIYPGPPQTWKGFVKGLTREARFFHWDYLWIMSDGYQVQIKPHYDKSTWDTFWTDGDGTVKCHAAFGLYRKTLGVQAQLLPGIVDTLDAVADQIEPTNEVGAEKIREIQKHLAKLVTLVADGEPVLIPLPKRIWFVEVTSERFWNWKHTSGPTPPRRTD